MDFYRWCSKVFRVNALKEDYYWCNILDIEFPFHYAIEKLGKYPESKKYANMFYFCASQKSYYEKNDVNKETVWIAAVKHRIHLEFWDSLFPTFFSEKEIFDQFCIMDQDGILSKSSNNN